VAAVGLDDNKKLVLEYWRLINENQSASALDLCSEDFVFQFPGLAPFGSRQTKEEAKKSFAAIFELFPEGLIITPGVMTAEDDRVAMEGESHAIHVSGAKYNNHYHFLFRIRDGEIVEIREHGDTHHARQVLGSEPRS
jgi:ketosteroid isomerase-like protein